MAKNWHLEDDRGFLPVGPFETRAEAQAFATDIECGRPVFITDKGERVASEAPEPQENTYERAKRAELDS